MKRLLLIVLAVAPFATAALLEKPIAVDGGQVAGTPSPYWTDGVTVFRGIPFAAPPVGDLRWRPPQPVVAWQGVKEADKFSAACIQQPTAKDSDAWQEGLNTFSEDCLYLNIWTPAKTAGANLPVMVFIHGGGNTRGAASELQYDGNNLTKKGVVFVTFNYRMGAFGFLAHPDLTRESEHRASGNYALQDQIAALKWIQRNIAKFGGDPGNVMVFGHSAGASNLAALTASPLAKGLFQRALAQSGGLGNRTLLADAEKAGVRFAESLGAHSIAELRAKSATEILNGPRTQNGPVVDGWVMPDDAYSIYAAGKQNDVPLIVGSVGDDGPGAAPPTTSVAAIKFAHDTYGDLADEYMKVFPVSTDAQAAKASHDLRRDRMLSGARTWVALQAKTGKSKAYWYLFDHAAPPPPGAIFSGHPASEKGSYHGGELVYIFDSLNLKDWPWTPVDHSLAGLMSTLWTNFVKTGNPNGPGMPAWSAYDPKQETLLYVTTAGKSQAPPYKAQLDFLEKAAAKQRETPAAAVPPVRARVGQ